MRLPTVALPVLLAAALLCSFAPVSAAPNVTAVLGTSQSRSPLPSGAEQITLSTSDGWKIAAWYWAPTTPKVEAPGVILLHQRGADKSSWGTFPAQLVKQGYAVIAIDLRGHGESLSPGGKPLAAAELQDPEYIAMLRDVRAADQYLGSQPGVDKDRIGIIGASLGANLAIIYLSANRHVRTAVCLSPGLDYKGLRPLEYMEAVDKRPLYLIAGRDDASSAQAAEEISCAGTIDGPKSLRLLDGKAHGTELLSGSTGLDKTISTGWLLNYLPPKR
jgi:dienelactone hydrolase